MKGPQRVVEEARKLVGVKWRHQGRKPWAVDCAGLVVLSFAAAGWPDASAAPARYGREPWDDMLRKTLVGYFGAPTPGPLQQGDVPLYRWGKLEPSHVGIIANHPNGGLSLIHSSNLCGVVEVGLYGEFEDCIIEVYRPNWGDL